MYQTLKLLAHEKGIFRFFIIEICFFILIPLTRIFLYSPIIPIFLILLIALEFLSFYYLYQTFQSLSKQAKDNVEKEYLIHQQKIQNEHILANMQAAKDFDQIKDQLIQIINAQTIYTDTDVKNKATEILESYADKLLVNYCPNKVIDAILYNKILLMKKLHIKYSIIAAIPETISIDNYAIMSILNNMLDNAIEACQTLDFKRRHITIDLSTHMNYLVFSIQNSIQENQTPILKPHYSTKSDTKSHGFGLEIIYQICQEHHGQFQYKIDSVNHTITCTATLQMHQSMNGDTYA